MGEQTLSEKIQPFGNQSDARLSSIQQEAPPPQSRRGDICGLLNPRATVCQNNEVVGKFGGTNTRRK